VIDRIEATGRGKPIGDQMLADAHGWVTSATVPTIPINGRSRVRMLCCIGPFAGWTARPSLY
jgi:hypothetical protein